MSRLSRAINPLLRPSQRPLKPSAFAPHRTPPPVSFSTRHAESSREDRVSSYDDSRVLDDDHTRFATHLNSVFRSLEFPPELARRILTHGSHRAAIHGHNGRLGFIGGYLFVADDSLLTLISVSHLSIGRRVLESYFLLFVHEVAQGRAQHDYDRLASRALNTYFLGEHIAPLWSVGRVLQWVPTAPRETLRTTQTQKPDSELDEALRASPGIAKSVGLYKVMGEAVQAVVGGVYHQFVRAQLRLLPRLRCLMTYHLSLSYRGV